MIFLCFASVIPAQVVQIGRITELNSDGKPILGASAVCLSDSDVQPATTDNNGFYPSPWLMKEACAMGVPAIISADAHHFSEISLEFEAAEQALKQAGYRSVVRYKDGRWLEKEIL